MGSRQKITQAMRQELALRVGGVPGRVIAIGCAYCNSSLIRVDWSDPECVRFLDYAFRARPEIDHVVSVYDGGPHTVENLVPACLSCNRSKCHLTISEWVAKRLAKGLANARQGPEQMLSNGCISHDHAPRAQYPYPLTTSVEEGRLSRS